MSSAGAAVRAPETVRSHLKGAVCEANLLQWNKHARHTQTHEARIRLDNKPETNTLSMHTRCNTVRAVRIKRFLTDQVLCRASYQILKYLNNIVSSY